ncbi:MAG: hypothetical protein M1822_008888 [Bathelium mastoideum]|nr:MAG: hypothetical protein M1822_008888 [Bathelium mastoideum]
MGKALTWGSAVFLATGGFLFGYDSGIITSTISQDQFIAYFSNPSTTVQGGIVSAFQGGAILGTIINLFTGNMWGRKRAIAVGSAIACLGCAIQAGAVKMVMLMIGRFIAGMAVGMLTSVVPMYAGELSEAKHRGILSGLLQWMLSWGFLVAQWLGYGCSFSNSPFQWRFPLAFQCIPAILLVSGVWFLTESPRWLMEKDRHEEARAVLYKLHADGTPEKDEYIELEYREIRDVIAADRLNRPQIYKILGFSNQTSLMIIGISGALSIVYCTIGLWLLDRVGRIKPLIVSAAGLAASLVVNAALSQHLDPSNGNLLRAMVAMNFVFSLFYTPLGIISWVYPAEIFPVEIRNQGNSITTFTNWTLNLIFAQFSPGALKNIGFRYFYVFFVFNLCAMLAYIFFYPETKGKTLEQMDEMFGDQLIPHALEDPVAANVAMEKGGIFAEEIERIEDSN